MMCWHKYVYVGWVDGYYWLAGVTGGVQIDIQYRAKECTKCGKTKKI